MNAGACGVSGGARLANEIGIGAHARAFENQSITLLPFKTVRARNATMSQQYLAPAGQSTPQRLQQAMPVEIETGEPTIRRFLSLSQEKLRKEEWFQQKIYRAAQAKSQAEQKIADYLEERFRDAILNKMDVVHLDFKNTAETEHAFALLEEQGYEGGMSWKYADGFHVEFELNVSTKPFRTHSPGKVKVWRALCRPGSHRMVEESSPESSSESSPDGSPATLI